jgi:riboflavin biosynthesis pyrimidine reductase
VRIIVNNLELPVERPHELTSDDLARAYAPPLGAESWFRVNMVSTFDGAGTGEDGLSGSINNAVDKVAYDVMRELADAIVVGAGTARAEGYEPTTVPTVVVSHQAALPPQLMQCRPGQVLLVTCSDAPGLEASRELVGDDAVLVLGTREVDLTRLQPALAERGWTHLLCEGGPHLLYGLLAAGVLDEVCMTLVPRAIGGLHTRIVAGNSLDVDLDLLLLLEEDGTLLGRWQVAR